MAGLDGVGSVRIIPAIRTIQLNPSAMTLRVGDTASIGATVISVNGDTLSDIPLVWRASDYGVIARVVFYGVSAMRRSVVEADSVGQNIVWAAAATSRQDSASNVKGQAQITVVPQPVP
jgi:hypothetical protein